LKGLALESVARWIILSVVIMVVIGIVLYIADSIREFVKSNIVGEKNEVKTEVVEADSFTTSQVANYIRLCWEKTGLKYKGDAVCYVLEGDMSHVDKQKVKEMVEKEEIAVDVTYFDTSKGHAVIMFKDLGNIVVVKN